MYTYLVQAVNGGSIKIGKTKQNPEDRLKGLQTGSPEILQIVGLIEGDIETKLHHQFKHLRQQGEWFENTPELLDFIASLNTGKRSKALEGTLDRLEATGKVQPLVRPTHIHKVFVKGQEFPIDFDFVFDTSDYPYELALDVCHTLDCPALLMGMHPREEWDALDDKDKSEWKKSWEEDQEDGAWGVDDSECYLNYSSALFPNENEIMEKIMEYVSDVQCSDDNFKRPTRFFNKVCISTERGCTFFFCNEIGSSRRCRFIDDLAQLCWKMDEFRDHEFIAYDQDNEQCLDLNVIARSKMFSEMSKGARVWDEEYRFKPEDIIKIAYSDS